MTKKQKGLLIFAIVALICWTIFWRYDYYKDPATKKGGDLYKTIVKRGYVIVGVKNDTPPFGYIDSTGQYVGFDVDIAHNISKELLHDSNKVKFVPVKDTDRFRLLNNGKVDMLIATMTITPKRQIFADFSNAYYITGQTLLVKKGSSVRSLGDLSNKPVGVIYGSTAEETIKFLLPSAKVLGYRTYEDAYRALKNGTVLGVTSDDAILRAYSLKDSSVTLLSKRYTRDSYGIALRRGGESDYLLDVINTVISDMDNRGVFIQLRHKWGLS